MLIPVVAHFTLGFLWLCVAAIQTFIIEKRRFIQEEIILYLLFAYLMILFGSTSCVALFPDNNPSSRFWSKVCYFVSTVIMIPALLVGFFIELNRQ